MERPRPAGFDDGRDSTAGTEVSLDDSPYRIAGLHDVFQYPVDYVLLKDAEIAVGEQIFLQGLQLEAATARHVTDRQMAEVGQAGFWTDRCEFRIVYQDLVTWKLVLPDFNAGKVVIETGSCVLIRVARSSAHNDIVRIQGSAICKQSFAEAIETYDRVVRVYEELGYRVVELPLCTVEERADFILQNLA
jgi:hypothetical protein